MKCSYFAMMILCLAAGVRASAADADLVRNGDFSAGASAWEGIGVTEDSEVAVVDSEPGGKVLLLRRIREDAPVVVAQHGIRLGRQRLYRLSVTGWGDGDAAVKLNPSSSQDPDFSGLTMSWATSAAPFPRTGKPPYTMTFVFDSGLKTDSASLSFYLRGKTPGVFRVADVSLVDIGSSKPDPGETVILHLGDSITITSYLPFHERVDRVLAGMIAQGLPGVKTRQLNLGVDGESIGALLDTGRYEKAIHENYGKIDVVIIRYGANDSRKYDVAEFKRRLRELCARLRKDYPGVRILLGTGTWALGLDWGNTHQYGPAWQAIRDVAAEDGYPLIDIYKRFEKEGTSATARAKADLHPSPLGVRFTAEVELDALRPILQMKPKQGE